MGMINIKISGSFGNEEKTFSAMDYGHADAIAQVIEWLSGKILPKAIRNDHNCHSDGHKPRYNYFGRDV